MAVSLVKMVRTPEAANNGPLAADVHPDEVANYKAGGWTVAAPEEKKASGKKKP